MSLDLVLKERESVIRYYSAENEQAQIADPSNRTISGAPIVCSQVPDESQILNFQNAIKEQEVLLAEPTVVSKELPASAYLTNLPEERYQYIAATQGVAEADRVKGLVEAGNTPLLQSIVIGTGDSDPNTLFSKKLLVFLGVGVLSLIILGVLMRG